MTKEEYSEKAKFIWKNYVPKRGQSEFVQGELLRAVEKLRDEAQRNGNINFNKNCHIILIEYLRKKLSDRNVFSDKQIDQINIDLNKLSLEEHPYIEDDVYLRITNRIVDWYIIYSDLIVHEKNIRLYC